MRLVAVVRSEASGERVRALGVDVVVGLDGAAKTVRALAGEVDVALDFSGAPAAPAVGIRMLRAWGRLVLGSVVDEPVELGTTTTSLVMRELGVVGAYNATLEDLRAVARLATDGRLDLSGSVSTVMPLDDAAEALAMVERRPPAWSAWCSNPDVYLRRLHQVRSPPWSCSARASTAARSSTLDTFAPAVLGSSVNSSSRSGQLVLHEVLGGEELRQPVERQVAAPAEHDAGARPLPVDRIGDADDRYLGHVGLGRDHLLDLPGLRFCPPRMITSLARPTMRRYPSSSTTPRLPER